MGLKVHLSGLPGLEGLEMHLGTSGYAGLAGIENGRVNVCGLFRRQPRLKGRGTGLLLAYLREGGLTELAARIEAAEQGRARTATSPGSRRSVAGPGGRCCGPGSSPVVACHDAGAAAVGEVGVCPLDENDEAVLESDEEDQVDKQPGQPGQEPAERNFSFLPGDWLPSSAGQNTPDQQNEPPVQNLVLSSCCVTTV